ncbi:MAG: methyltransferase family protein [Betaproteobacteria bacterium]
MRSVVIRGYAVIAYLAFVLTTLWAAGFLADRLAPTTVDGSARGPVWTSLLIDGALLLVFAVQHTVMARAGFKRHLPRAVERSTYVLAASLALSLVFWQWRSVPTVVWSVTDQPWPALIWFAYGLGWLIVFAVTFMIDHWDFVGLRQTLASYRAPGFKERWLYAWVRHPLMLGLLITFWATPHLSVGRLFFAAAGSAYIAIGIRFEERDLRRHLGTVYDDYAQRVPALVPTPRRLPQPHRELG